ncbi:hypothetical protein HMPREF3232_00293 [Fannyhessea vaginae]|nr:hypothetical protein HMPREF3232_00293 [Fannyhessea vaginae]
MHARFTTHTSNINTYNMYNGFFVKKVSCTVIDISCSYYNEPMSF